ncbi:MAG TPA: hypothetical protein VMI54_23695 [Polyangiaceae bacterium]|nr:hypothetical protein [Polyangiaceae bacterium]
MAARSAGSSTRASRSSISAGSTARGRTGVAARGAVRWAATGRTWNRSELAATPSACTRPSRSVVKNESSWAHAAEATCSVSTPLRSRPGSVRAAMRSPTARRHASRSITTPPARALTSRACSSSAPIDDGEREDVGLRGGSVKD